MPDKKKKGHFLLTITEPMTLYQLVQKLKMVAYRMSVMKDARKAL